MTDVFEEVEEGLRQDKAGELWKRFGPWVIGLCILVILGVAGNEVWRSIQTSRSQADSKTYGEAMDAMFAWQEASFKVNDPQANPNQKAAAAAAAGAARQNAVSKFEAIAKGNDAYSMLARQELAELSVSGEADTAKAAGYLDASAKGQGVYADISRLKLAYLKADTASLAELTGLLDPLMKTDGVMKSLSRELLAAKKLATGDAAGARADYLSLANDYNAPQGMRQRVNSALASLPKPAAAAASPAPAASAAPVSPPALSPKSPSPSAQATK